MDEERQDGGMDAGTDEHGWGRDVADLVEKDGRMELTAGGIVFHLLKPIGKEGEECTSITFTEPGASQLEKMAKVPGKMRKTDFLIEQYAGLAAPDQKRLGVRDLGRIGSLLNVFAKRLRGAGDR